MRQATPIMLTDEQRIELERRVRSQTLDARSVRRARIVLLAADGTGNHDIARRLGISRGQVISWRNRFMAGGIAGISGDLPGRGRKPTIDAAEIVRVTTQTKPEGATHWSTRKLAARLGISDTSVLKVWRANGLKPHLVKSFKVSRDPKFVEKLEDIVGLYMSPPEHALVLCCDEKSQVQALDRTQPGLPLKKGRAETMTHDYKRNGTTTLFAAMSTLDGSVISRCAQRHRHVEWLDFLRQINRETPKDKALHLVCDNYATHKHPKVKEWLNTSPRDTAPRCSIAGADILQKVIRSSPGRWPGSTAEVQRGEGFLDAFFHALQAAQGRRRCSRPSAGARRRRPRSRSRSCT
jgi:transposase